MVSGGLGCGGVCGRADGVGVVFESAVVGGGGGLLGMRCEVELLGHEVVGSSVYQLWLWIELCSL